LVWSIPGDFKPILHPLCLGAYLIIAVKKASNSKEKNTKNQNCFDFIFF
jgi:hypothetical protein